MDQTGLASISSGRESLVEPTSTRLARGRLASSLPREADVTNHARPYDRPELHNPSIDEEVALLGACALVHLPTGNTCTLAHHHAGSCDFVPRDEIPHALSGDATRHLPG